MLEKETAVLVLIDVQEKLFRVIDEKEALIDNLQRLIRGAQALELPILVTEQNPDGLGGTLPEIADLFTDFQPIIKFSFSCCGEPAFMDALRNTGRNQILLCGIETHVCVYQTAALLAASGYEVQVVADTVSSRSALNKKYGLDKCREEGAGITTMEIALFELLKTAKSDVFKQISKIVK